MWQLTNRKTGTVYYVLSEKPKHIIGRTGCDLILKDDSSISRHHANLYPSNNSIKIIDIGSKYGTYINENIELKKGIMKNIPIELENGTRICFGILDNIWILSKINLITLTSAINIQDKTTLKTILKSLNGTITETFTSQKCTHLTMSGITVTTKLLYALIERIPIVNCQYWIDYLNNLRNCHEPPNPINIQYIPNVIETFLKFPQNIFLPNENRKQLFVGKTFIFIGKKHYDTYKPIIEKAGGNVKSLNQGIKKTLLIDKNVIVIQYIASTQSQSSQTIDDISDFLQKNSLRVVPDYEIGLAIVNCSIQKYCNPQYNILLKEVCSNLGKELPPPENLLEAIVHETPISNVEIVNETPNMMASEEIPESTVYDNLSDSIPNTVENNQNLEILCNDTSKNRKSNENLLADKGEERPVIIPDINQEKRKRNDDSIESDSNVNVKKLCSQEYRETVKTNLLGFLNSQQISDSNKETTTADDDDAFSENNKMKKRPRIPYYSSSDDEDHEKQTSSGPKKPKFVDLNSDDEDDNLFNFGEILHNQPSISSNPNPTDQISTELLPQTQNSNINKEPPIIESTTTATATPNQNNETPAILLYRPRIEVPKKQPSFVRKSDTTVMSSVGWLSSNLIKMNIKNENLEIKNEHKFNPFDVDPDASKWIDSIRGGFEVRVKNMSLVSRSYSNNITMNDNTNTTASNSTSKNLNNSNCKNFKAFVKKQNYKHQKHILTTVPVQIHGFSF